MLLPLEFNKNYRTSFLNLIGKGMIIWKKICDIQPLKIKKKRRKANCYLG
jgi:hypothetical protein